MNEQRVAIVGMGGFAREHRNYVERAEAAGLARQVAQVAIRADREAFAAELDAMSRRGVRVFGSLREMLAADRERIDVVCIPTGIPLHRPMTIAALEAGCHVLVEKPAAGSIQDVDAMLRAVDHSGKLCAVGFQHIYQTEYRRLKAWVCAGRLGDIRLIKSYGCWPRQPAYYQRNQWAGRMAVGDSWVLDGPHNNALAHAVNAMLFMASPVPGQALTPARVRAELYRANEIESTDTVAMRVQTLEGPEVFFAASHCTDQRLDPLYTIEGSEGCVELAYTGDVRARWANGTTEEIPAVEAPRLVLDDLLQVVGGNRQALMCPLRMARSQVICSCAAFESSGVHTLPADLRTVSSQDGTVITRGMTEAVLQAYEDAALFSELGLEWGERGSEIEVADYAYFPTYRRLWSE